MSGTVLEIGTGSRGVGTVQGPCLHFRKPSLLGVDLPGRILLLCGRRCRHLPFCISWIQDGILVLSGFGRVCSPLGLLLLLNCSLIHHYCSGLCVFSARRTQSCAQPTLCIAVKCSKVCISKLCWGAIDLLTAPQHTLAVHMPIRSLQHTNVNRCTTLNMEQVNSFML